MKKLLAATAVAVAFLLVPATVYADPIDFTKKEKAAKSWTPAIEAKLRSGLEKAKAEHDDVLSFDVECVISGIKDAWSSPRALNRDKKKKKAETIVKGITLDCLEVAS